MEVVKFNCLYCSFWGDNSFKKKCCKCSIYCPWDIKWNFFYSVATCKIYCQGYFIILYLTNCVSWYRVANWKRKKPLLRNCVNILENRSDQGSVNFLLNVKTFFRYLLSPPFSPSNKGWELSQNIVMALKCWSRCYFKVVAIFFKI